jgi:hypothetical protein
MHAIALPTDAYAILTAQGSTLESPSHDPLEPPFRACHARRCRRAHRSRAISPAKAWRCYVWTRIAGPGGRSLGDRPRAGAPRDRQLLLPQRRGGRATCGTVSRPADRLRAARSARARLRRYARHVRAAAGAGEPGARHLVRERACRLSRCIAARVTDAPCSASPTGSLPAAASGRVSASSSPTPIPARCALYQSCGYREQGRRKKAKEDWQAPGTDWILLTKRV